MTTDRLTVKVNCILDAQNNGKINFDVIIHKNFKSDQKRQIQEEICEQSSDLNIHQDDGKFNLDTTNNCKNLTKNTKYRVEMRKKFKQLKAF